MDKQLFYKHVRADEITKVLNNYFRTFDTNNPISETAKKYSLEEINNIILEEKERRMGKGETFDKVDNDIFISKEEIIEVVSEIFDQTQNIEDVDNAKEKIICDVLDYWDKYGRELDILESEYSYEIEESNFILKGSVDLIYKTENGIAILDYKTSNLDNKSPEELEDLFKKYKKQLYTYALALKEDEQQKNTTYANIARQNDFIQTANASDFLQTIELVEKSLLLSVYSKDSN